MLEDPPAGLSLLPDQNTSRPTPQLLSPIDAHSGAASISMGYPRSSLGRVKDSYELPVDCWTLDGGLLLRSFSSIRAAAEALAIPHPRLLANCIFEEPPVAYGFQWRLNSTKPREEKGVQLSIEVSHAAECGNLLWYHRSCSC